MDWIYFPILIDVIIDLVQQHCAEEIAIFEMNLELDDIDADLDEIGAFLGAAGVLPN